MNQANQHLNPTFFLSIVQSFFHFQNGGVQGCSCDGLIQMMKNLKKQENGSKGGVKVATSKMYFRS